MIPNLLVEGISQAIRRSRAVKAYFVNLMWQPGETSHFTASDHIRAIEKHAGGKLLDYAIVNTQPIRASLEEAVRVPGGAAGGERPGADRGDGDQGGGRELFCSNRRRCGTIPEEIAAVALRLARQGRARAASRAGSMDFKK